MMLVALMTNDMVLLGTAELVFDRLTPYIRQEVDGLDMVFERVPGACRVPGAGRVNVVPMYRALSTFMVTNFRRAQ